MRIQYKNNHVFFRVIPLLVFFLALPVILAFDSIMYFLTKPACLNCGSLIGFLQSGSLSVFLLTSITGYKFKAPK